jgi:1-acyl-sn-glycerol-3-phosphate acyltransferase
MKLYRFFPLLSQKLIWLPTRFVLFFFAHLEVRGLEKISDVKSNVIFATNHSSEIDPFLVPASLSFFSRFSPLFYATRERSFYDRSGWRKYLFGGWFINIWGGYTVQAGQRDYEKSLKSHIEIIKEKQSFCIFPEGGINRDPSVMVAHGGVIYLSEVGNCPIIPVGTSGTINTTVKDFFLGRKKIVVTFGSPIYSADRIKTSSDPNKYKVEAEYVMTKVKELVKRGHEEVPVESLDPIATSPNRIS